MRERLLRTYGLTLKKAVEIVKAAEQTQQQVKLMSGQEVLVNSIKHNKNDRNLTMRKRQDGLGKGKFSDEDPPPKKKNNCKIPVVIVGDGMADITVQRSVRSVTVVASSTILRKCRSKNVSVVQEDLDSESDSPYVINVISKNKKKK